MAKRIKRPDISGAHGFRYNEACSDEAKVIINYLLDYIYYLELQMAMKGNLRTSVTGFDDVIDEETSRCKTDKCLCGREE